LKYAGKICIIAVLIAVDIISIFFHYYIGKSNDIVFWLTSIIGTISIIAAAFPIIDLVLDRMYGFKQYNDY
jgi:hypothetical protein